MLATQPEVSAPRPLIVRVRNFIGDVVLGIPALERLQRAGYELHLVGKPWAKSLLEAYGWPVARYPKSFADRRALLADIAHPLRARDASFDKRVNAVTFATSFSVIASRVPEGALRLMTNWPASVRGKNDTPSSGHIARLRTNTTPKPASTRPGMRKVPDTSLS